MKNIYLVGFMGTGKSVVGRILADKLKKDFVEIDELIQQREGKPIIDIFSQDGEAYFRSLEKKVLKELSSKQDLVVSCGGGLVCNEGNLRLLKETGWVFCLKAGAKAIYERTKEHVHRPLLNVEDPLKMIEELLEKRAPYYNKAHYFINTEGVQPSVAADKIIAVIDNG